MTESRRAPPTAPRDCDEALQARRGVLPSAGILIGAVGRSLAVLLPLLKWRLRGFAASRTALAQRTDVAAVGGPAASSHAHADRLGLRDALSALRVPHWSKNLLVVLPALAGQRLLEPGVPLRLAALFAAFSLCASAIYLLNDVADADADRRHPVKRLRPVASGRMPPAVALGLAACLAAAGILVVVMTVRSAFWLLVTYLFTGASYSLYWKPLPLVDVFGLTGLHLLRLGAGHTVSDIALSPWLFALAFFLLLSLALCKRASELAEAPEVETTLNSGRGYRRADLAVLEFLGCASGVCSSLVLAIYTQSKQVHLHYAEPAFLMLASPLLLFWIGRMWLLSHRGQLHGDPLNFAMRDGLSYLTLICGLLLMLVAWKGWIHVPMIE